MAAFSLSRKKIWAHIMSKKLVKVQRYHLKQNFRYGQSVNRDDKNRYFTYNTKEIFTTCFLKKNFGDFYYFFRKCATMQITWATSFPCFKLWKFNFLRRRILKKNVSEKCFKIYSETKWVNVICMTCVVSNSTSGR